MMLSVLTTALALTATVLGHHETEEEQRIQAATLRRIAAHSKRTLANCAGSPAAIALKERAVARRAAWADELRTKRGLKTRKMLSFPLNCILIAVNTLTKLFV